MKPAHMASYTAADSFFVKQLLATLLIGILSTVADATTISQPTFGTFLPPAAAHPSRLLVKYKSNSTLVPAAGGVSGLELIHVITLPENESVAAAVTQLSAQPGEPKAAGQRLDATILCPLACAHAWPLEQLQAVAHPHFPFLFTHINASRCSLGISRSPCCAHSSAR